MKKIPTHKFVIIEGSYDEGLDTVKYGAELLDRISYTWEDRIRVVECSFPVFDDNCVDLVDRDGVLQNFVVATNGTLYYWTDVMTKFEIIEAFE